MNQDKISYFFELGDERSLENHIFYASKNIEKFLLNGEIPEVFPPQAQIDLTNKCNLNCDYCSFASSHIKQKDTELPLDELIDFLTYYYENGGISIFLTGGGEPGEYSRIFELLDFFSKIPLILTLNTNGLFIKRLEELSEKRKDILKNIWSMDKEGVISISWQNNESIRYVERLRNLINRLKLNLKVRVTFLINKETKIEAIDKFIKKIKASGADVAAPKPMHIGTNRIGSKGEKGERIFDSNDLIYDYLDDLVTNQKGSDFIIAPMRLDRIKSSFQSTRRVNYNEIICLASFTRMVINAHREYSICCTAKLPGIGMGDKYFPCGNALEKSVSSYYMDVLWGMINFENFYCIYGCGYKKLNEDWEDIGTSYLSCLKFLRRQYQDSCCFDKKNFMLSIVNKFKFSNSLKKDIVTKFKKESKNMDILAHCESALLF